MVEVLLSPEGGVPPLLSSAREIEAAAARLAAGTGPVAVDAERASGFTYDDRAFLLQLKRAGAGSFLIDPTVAAQSVSGALAEAINPLEWILHSASNDLPCLYDLGLAPGELFDTELAARLCGFEHVSLAALVEQELQVVLTKGHGGENWSKRPLPQDWLVYAALDVEKLIELRLAMREHLAAQQKSQWAHQEFEFLRQSYADGNPKPPKTWRDAKGLRRLRHRSQLQVARGLWQWREGVARESDLAVSRILPDRLLIDVAHASPRSVRDLYRVPGFSSRYRRWQHAIVDTVHRSLRVPQSEWPQVDKARPYPPPRNLWQRLNPVAAENLEVATILIAETAEDLRVPVENVIRPAVLREVVWEFSGAEQGNVAAALKAHQVRPWQAEIVIPLLERALR